MIKIVETKGQRIDTAIVDCVVTKSAKFAVCIIMNDGASKHIIYENAQMMDENVHLFLRDNLVNIDTVITDCSIGTLPTVVKAVALKSENHLQHLTTKRYIPMVEKIMHNLYKSY
ncbi:MAG: hypothetical protein RLN88_04215 [Ekhidna sp.]|uniref:hypothetical protein n=1 Tax=Ekhidna sp. TaxID=2608089 RepID=UPI0032EAE920